jgi:hypothetical protein
MGNIWIGVKVFRTLHDTFASNRIKNTNTPERQVISHHFFQTKNACDINNSGIYKK